MRNGLSFLFGILIGVLFKPIIVRAVWTVVEYVRLEFDQVVGMWR